jgi:hypothetical protein
MRLGAHDQLGQDGCFRFHGRSNVHSCGLPFPTLLSIQVSEKNPASERATEGQMFDVAQTFVAASGT